MKTTLKCNEEAKKIYFNYEAWSRGKERIFVKAFYAF